RTAWILAIASVSCSPPGTGVAHLRFRLKNSERRMKFENSVDNERTLLTWRAVWFFAGRGTEHRKSLISQLDTILSTFNFFLILLAFKTIKTLRWNEEPRRPYHQIRFAAFSRVVRKKVERLPVWWRLKNDAQFGSNQPESDPQVRESVSTAT